MKKGIVTAILTILPLVMLTGCGGSSPESSAGISSSNTAASSEAFSTAYDYDSGSYESLEATAEKGSASQSDITQKLVYTGNLDIETLDYAATITNLRNRIKEYGGFIENEYERNSNRDWYMENSTSGGTMHMSMTVRIPSENYEPFISSIEGAERIMSKTSQVDNITLSYYETSALLESARIQEERLLEMLREAQEIEDMIAVEARLAEVQSQLNVYKNRLAVMDTDVAYSTVSLNVDEVRGYTEVRDDYRFIDRLVSTIKDSWSSFWNILEWLLFFIIRLIPILIIFIPIILLVIFIIRKIEARQSKYMRKLAQQESVMPMQPIYPPMNVQPPMPPEQPKQETPASDSENAK